MDITVPLSADVERQHKQNGFYRAPLFDDKLCAINLRTNSALTYQDEDSSKADG